MDYPMDFSSDFNKVLHGIFIINFCLLVNCNPCPFGTEHFPMLKWMINMIKTPLTKRIMQKNRANKKWQCRGKAKVYEFEQEYETIC